MMTTERIIGETEIDCLKKLRVEEKKNRKASLSKALYT